MARMVLGIPEDCPGKDGKMAMQSYIEKNKTIIYEAGNRPMQYKNLSPLTYWFENPHLNQLGKFRIRFIDEHGNVAEITLKDMDAIREKTREGIEKMFGVFHKAIGREKTDIETALKALGYTLISGPISEQVKRGVAEASEQTWAATREVFDGFRNREKKSPRKTEEPSTPKTEHKESGKGVDTTAQKIKNLERDIANYNRSLKAINDHLNGGRDLGKTDKEDYARQKMAFEKRLRKAREGLEKLRKDTTKG